jgi:DNA-binding transcriptional ArsR family regulator
MSSPLVDELNLLHRHVCRALGDPTRLQILYALHRQPTRVTDLAEALAMPQSTVSRHLAVLRQSMLLSAERSGTEVIYRLADERVIDVLDLMRQVLREALERQASALD